MFSLHQQHVLFLTHANAFLIHSKREQLDGIDFNNQSLESMDDFKEYFRFIMEVAPVIKDHPATHKKLKLSLTLSVTQIMPKEVYEKVDRVHVMTFDMTAGDYKGKPGKILGETFVCHFTVSIHITISQFRSPRKTCFCKRSNESVYNCRMPG